MRQTKNQQTNKMDFDITTALLPAESMFSFSFLSLSFYFSRSRFLFFCSFLRNFVCVHHNFCSRLACSRFFYEKKIGTYLCQQRCVFSPEYMCCTKQQAESSHMLQHELRFLFFSIFVVNKREKVCFGACAHPLTALANENMMNLAHTQSMSIHYF